MSKVAAYSQKAKENLENVNQMIQDITTTFIENPDTIMEMMKFSEKFYKYSLNNRFLIYSQNPYATYVQSFQAWKKMGYSVQKGQKGMKILFPQMITYVKTDDNKWVKLSMADKDTVEKYKAGEIENRQLMSFGVGNVFDISQTTCPAEDYPKFFDMGFADIDRNKIYEAIVNYCDQKLNTKVVTEDMSSISLRGENYVGRNKIVLNKLLKDSEKLSTLVHEMAHQQLHQDMSRFDKPVYQIEFEADAYSVMVNQHIGIENTVGRKRHMTENFNRVVLELQKNGYQPAEVREQVKSIVSNVFSIYDATIGDIDAEIDKSISIDYDRNMNKGKNKKLEADRTQLER